jgi:uncharacterized protein YbjT (DUF2867 family)
MKKAIVIGSTGMVGSQLIIQLLDSDNYSQVISLGRRNCGIAHPKLIEHIVDFGKPETWQHLIQGDVLFSALGTTLATAGSKDEQYKVDFTYQFNVARAAAENGVKGYVLVSSGGANSGSRNFYLKMKGKLEDEVNKLGFGYICIMRPAQLDGDRKEKRPTEKIALRVMHGINKVGLLRRYRPIMAYELASAMVAAASGNESRVYVMDEIFQLI